MLAIAISILFAGAAIGAVLSIRGSLITGVAAVRAIHAELSAMDRKPAMRLRPAGISPSRMQRPVFQPVSPVRLAAA